MHATRGPSGIVFDSGAPAVVAGDAGKRDFAPGDRVRWGVCAFFDGCALCLTDGNGLVELGITHGTAEEAVEAAQKALGRYWPNGCDARRDDRYAAEIVSGAMSGCSFRLHMVLTPFQERILRATCAIPRGEVRTYGWVARGAGAPKAVRAAANALHNNPVALVVPCHRVVPATGGVGGYACGTNLKRRILLAEGVAIDARNNLVLPHE